MGFASMMISGHAAAAIPWFDHRDKAEAEYLLASDEGRAHPWINYAFSTAAAKWLWLRSTARRRSAGKDPWITLTDFPAVWWARRKFICTTLMPRTGVYDVFKRQWIPGAVAEGGSATPAGGAGGGNDRRHRLFRGPCAEAGAADGNTLVVVGGHDHPIASNAIMRLEPLARIDSIGTANALFAETVTPSAGAATAGIDLSLPVRGGPGISVIGPIEFSVPLRQAFGSDDAVKAYLAAPHLPGAPAEQAPGIAQALAGTRCRPLPPCHRGGDAGSTGFLPRHDTRGDCRWPDVRNRWLGPVPRPDGTARQSVRRTDHRGAMNRN